LPFRLDGLAGGELGMSLAVELRLLLSG